MVDLPSGKETTNAETRTVVGLVAPGLASPTLADDVCKAFKDEVADKAFVARVPLYDTEVDARGVVDLERDDEEIPQGAEFVILDVDCGKKDIQLKLQQELVGRKPAKVEIYLLSQGRAKGGRRQNNARDNPEPRCGGGPALTSQMCFARSIAAPA